MFIKSLSLNDYRNYSRFYLDFHPNLNIIIGPNGIGKTNVLESIIVVSNTKSFRTNIDQNLIKNDREYLKIDVDADVGKFKVVVNNKNKSLYFNDKHVKKTSEFIGKLNAILFIPDDITLFSDTPSSRRRIIDIEIGKVSNKYLDALTKYNNLLKEKNKLLKEENIDEILLESIEEMMLPYIETIIIKREEFFNVINKYLSANYKKISNKENQITVIYKKCALFSSIKEEMLKNRDKDRYYHYAYFGPHHEDYYFKMDDLNLVDIASQGQKRMTMIAFKLSLLEYIKKSTDNTPIILLDDVLSELDQNNKERLLEILPKEAQIIITDTNIDNLKISKDYKFIDLRGGVNV